MMGNKCTICKKNYKILCDNGMCYHCFLWKYNVVPTTGAYQVEEKK